MRLDPGSTTAGAGASMGHRMWGGRFDGTPAQALWKLSVSLPFDRRLYHEDVAVSIAHADMLAAQGILAPEEAHAICGALRKIEEEIDLGSFTFAETDEDIHTAIERSLVERLGPVGGKLRAGRSRNDQVVTDLRLHLKRGIRELGLGVCDVQEALLAKAETAGAAVFPGMTHFQPAQPVLVAHHLLAYVAMLERDAGRLADCAARMDVSGLGAGALAGSGLPLDPEASARALGFAGTFSNSIDAVADRDFAVEFLAAGAILAMHLSRLAEELVIWSNPLVGFVEMDDAYSTGSSIMPQKKNPDAAELVRGKAGRVIGDLVALLVVLKGLPLAYDRDLQEDKEPVFDALDTLTACLAAMAGTVAGLRLDVSRMEAAAGIGFSVATDLAEMLVARGVAFADAHRQVGGLVKRCVERGIDLSELEAEDVQALAPKLSREDLVRLTPQGAVRVRRTPGGTAPERVGEQHASARQAVERRRRGLEGRC
ncbi:MAG: argininosuccinate lyase [Actinomycetota bacterium]